MSDYSIINLGIVVMVALGMFMGAYTSLYGFSQAGYDIEPPGGSGTAGEIMEDMETTATDLKASLTGEQSWLQTTFNIFFTLPNNVMSTLSTISNSATKMISIGVDEENPITVPNWALNLTYIFIAFIIISSLLYLALGRRG